MRPAFDMHGHDARPENMSDLGSLVARQRERGAAKQGGTGRASREHGDVDRIEAFSDGPHEADRGVVATDVHRRKSLARQHEPRDWPRHGLAALRPVPCRHRRDLQQATIRSGELNCCPRGDGGSTVAEVLPQACSGSGSGEHEWHVAEEFAASAIEVVGMLIVRQQHGVH